MKEKRNPPMDRPASCRSILTDSLCRPVGRMRHQVQHQTSMISAGRPAVLALLLLAFAFAPRVCTQTPNYEGPVGVTGIFNGNVTTGCSYDPLTHSARREVTDIVVPGSLGKYTLKMTRYYNSRSQYYGFNPPDFNRAIGLIPGWSHEYSWVVVGAGPK